MENSRNVKLKRETLFNNVYQFIEERKIPEKIKQTFNEESKYRQKK